MESRLTDPIKPAARRFSVDEYYRMAEAGILRRGVKKHPTPGDIYLVVEVSDTTLAYDSGDKLRAYERGGIKEYWIVDLVSKAVRIHRLKEGRYKATSQRHSKISPEHFPDVAVDLGELF